jgi:hypothetical protein
MDDTQPGQATRSGFALSFIAHVAVFVGVLAVLGGPREFASTPVDAITVDIVPPQEAPAEPARPAEESLLPSQQGEAGPDSARQEPQRAGQPDQPPSSDPPQEAAPQPTPQPQAMPQQATPQQPPPQQPARQPSPSVTQAPGAPQPEQSIFDPSRIPQLLDMTPPTGDSGLATGPGVDAPAEAPAKLTAAEVGQLKAHLRRCWKQPRGVDSASRTRVVMRVFLGRDGSLAAEPELTAAPGRQEGLQLKQAAEQALRQCQPFAFLPADRYDEWKILDIDFSPRDMTGG